MKKLLFAFLVLAIMGSCYAVSIDVQDSIPANTVWSFSVRLPNASDFENAQVLLDGDSLIRVYAPSNKILSPDQEDIDKTRVFSNTEPIDNTIYFLVSPLAKGSHDIALKVDDEDETEKEVLFFEIFDADEQGDLQSRLDSLRGTVNSVVEQVNGFEGRLSEALTEEDKQALQSSINSTKDSITALESRLKQQETESNAKIDVLLQDLEAQRARINDLNKPLLFGVGFASLGGVSQELVGLGILFVVVIAAAILVVKFRDRIPVKKGLYGKPKKEEATFSKQDKDIAGQAMTEAQEETSKGKWAFGSKKQPKEESKRFNIGDLIRKD